MTIVKALETHVGVNQETQAYQYAVIYQNPYASDDLVEVGQGKEQFIGDSLEEAKEKAEKFFVEYIRVTELDKEQFNLELDVEVSEDKIKSIKNA